jgi:hypothetical protein
MQKIKKSIDALHHWLEIFDEMRAKGAMQLSRFTNSLADELKNQELNETDISRKTLNLKNKIRFEINKEDITKYKKEKTKNSIFKLLIRQKIKLNKIKELEEKTLVTAVALSAVRLNFGSSESSARSELNKIIKELPSLHEHNPIIELIDDRNVIFLFIPEWSNIWSEANEYLNEDVFVIDYYFLMYTLVTSPFGCLKELWINRSGITRLTRKRTKGYQIRLMVALLINYSYKKLFTGVNHLNTIFLTSNSFASELLRVYALSSRSESNIYEIQHGVPTTELEEYLEEIDADKEAKKAIFYIPQVKGLPFVGLLRKENRIFQDLAINIAMNKFVKTWLNNYRDIDSNWNFGNIRKLIDEISEKTLVVSFMGAASHDEDYFSSSAFFIEKMLIYSIEKSLLSRDISYVLIYSPHPANDIEECVKQNIFDRENILLHKDSQLMWLVADGAIALYSSAIFDAMYSGVKVFTPLRNCDEIYSPELLNLTVHPGDDEPCLIALERFIEELLSESPSGVQTKMNNRLTNWISPKYNLN